MKTTTKNQRGFTHHLALLVVGVLVLGVVSGAGYYVYRRTVKAKAAVGYGMFSEITSPSGGKITVMACHNNGSSAGRYYVKNTTPTTVTVSVNGVASYNVSANSNGSARTFPVGQTINANSYNAGIKAYNYGISSFAYICS